ncbi:MAG: 3-hydroxyacyl-ACP dehydratase FabZ family protein [Cyanobacteria bacterium P01_H01_bin.105]
MKGFDHISELSETHISVEKQIDPSEPFFKGHYPEFPIYPGVFIIETVCQGIRQYQLERGHRVRLVEVLSTRFIEPVLPGYLLESHCELIEQSYDTSKQLHVNSSCFCNKAKVSELKLLFEFE